MKSVLRTAVLLAALLGAAPAGALAIVSGFGASHSSPPAELAGVWDQLGSVGISTAIHLGDGWVLTAGHVGPGPVTLGGTSHAAVAGSVVQITNGDGSDADLVLFQIENPPPAGLLSVAPVSPALGDTLFMVGAGLGRTPAPGFWDSGWSPVLPGTEVFTGWELSAPAELRWGTNLVDAAGIPVSYGSWTTQMLVAGFDAAGLGSEAMAARGDSGGAVFAIVNGQVTLVGVMLAIAGFPGQPADTAVFGNATYMADLSAYRDQISGVVSLVPEPGTLLLVALGLPGLGRRRAAQPRKRGGRFSRNA